MVDATQILGELLGGGNRGSGRLTSGSGAKSLEDLLGVGSGQQSGSGGGGVFGGGDQQTGGGGTARGGQSQGGGGVFGGGDAQTENRRQAPTGSGSIGDLLGKALKELTGQKQPQTRTSGPASGGNNPFDAPQSSPVNQNHQSEVYIRAMIQAGLADGRLDEKEQQAILQKIGNVGQAESNFIRAEMAKGCDVNAFIHTVPRGIEEDVYALSLMAIQLDNRTEAQYLDALAKGLRITEAQSNAIHDRLGAQRLYS